MTLIRYLIGFLNGGSSFVSKIRAGQLTAGTFQRTIFALTELAETN
jgi:hypothetical protein